MRFDPNERTALYTIFDSEGGILYIGVSVNPLARWSAHSVRDWWYRVARVDVTWFDTRVQAEAAEEEMIKKFDPPFNINHTSRRGWTRPQLPVVVTPAGSLVATNQRSIALERRLDAGEWMTIGDVVAVLGSSRTKVHNMMKSGLLPFRTKPGSKYRYCDPVAVKRVLEESRVIR